VEAVSKLTIASDGYASTVRIGMPHLALKGLSENWLLKECGDRHWRLLAYQLGLPDTDFRDLHGNRLYAGFTALRMCHARLASVRESDELTLVSSLRRLSRTQYLGSHSVLCEGQPVADVAMTSVFMRRAVQGTNRHVVRANAVSHGLPPINETMRNSDLADIAHQMRAANWKNHLGFQPSTAATLAKFIFRPCPFGDFNGADFLYFASFQSIVDRAEWEWNLSDQVCSPTVHREIFYYANIDVGERVSVVLCAKHTKTNPSFGTQISTKWCKISRESDGTPLADVFTSRQLIN
jgi:probable biosynthetic protein (TIGR04099 family)